MALLPAERLSCFELLEAFWDSSGSVHDGFGIQLTLTELDELKDAITTKMDALDADAVLKVQAIVADYDLISGTSLKIDGGGTGNISGLSLDIDKEQSKLRRRLLTYIPVMHIADAIKKKLAPIGGDNCQIGISRL